MHELQCEKVSFRESRSISPPALTSVRVSQRDGRLYLFVALKGPLLTRPRCDESAPVSSCFDTNFKHGVSRCFPIHRLDSVGCSLCCVALPDAKGARNSALEIWNTLLSCSVVFAWLAGKGQMQGNRDGDRGSPLPCHLSIQTVSTSSVRSPWPKWAFFISPFDPRQDRQGQISL